MTRLPDDLAQYFATGDELARASVVEQHPGLPAALGTAETRARLLDWLSDEEPWQEDRTEMLVQVLQFLRGTASEADAPRVKPFLLHPRDRVRLRAYEFLTALYFPDRNREALFLLLNGMLSDEGDDVRAAGAAYAQRAGAVPELRDFLTRWRALAPARGWTGTQSYELVTRLLEP
jgi:hypothetical protein